MMQLSKKRIIELVREVLINENAQNKYLTLPNSNLVTIEIDTKIKSLLANKRIGFAFLTNNGANKQQVMLNTSEIEDKDYKSLLYGLAKHYNDQESGLNYDMIPAKHSLKLRWRGDDDSKRYEGIRLISQLNLESNVTDHTNLISITKDKK